MLAVSGSIFCAGRSIRMSTSCVIRGSPWKPLATEPPTAYGMASASRSSTTRTRTRIGSAGTSETPNVGPPAEGSDHERARVLERGEPQASLTLVDAGMTTADACQRDLVAGALKLEDRAK